MSQVFSDKVFYHIYALGMGNCAKRNDFACPAGDFFEKLAGRLDEIRALGCNALLIGPVFESTAHGYDTVDYYHVERRLGNNERFKEFCRLCHEKGFAVVLDAVFNHTGRDFFAFKDIQRHGYGSAYKDWYVNLDFSRRSAQGDCFEYEGWAGCKDLVKLNGDSGAVREHLFGAVKMWIEEFGIDGLRLDAADVLSKDFLDALGSFCRSIKPDFWLMGEVVHGDYAEWVRNGRLDSVTNYQMYKALWSCLNDQNMYELSYNLDREYNSERGMYRDSALYNFVDNHDVNRAVSTLNKPEQHIHLLYGLLFTIPGIPSIYYGSEYGIRGVRSHNCDYELRPPLPPLGALPDFTAPGFDAGFIRTSITTFAKIRGQHPALQRGSYRQEFVANRQFGFWREYREYNEEKILIIVNADFAQGFVSLHSIPAGEYESLTDGRAYHSDALKGLQMPPCSILILRKK